MHRPPPAGLFSHRPLHHAMHAALLGLVLLGTTHTAGATEQAIPQASAPRHYTIPAGPLGRVLANFASQAGLALAFEPALTEGLNSPGLNGSFTPQAALQRLLTDSRLEPVQRSDGSYTLKKQAAAATGHNGEASLPPLVVSAAGERESASGPLRGYVARRSATATKTDTPLLETAQSITVVGQPEIQALGAATVTDVLRYVAGAQTQSYGQDDRGWEWIALRGFSSHYQNSFMNGLKQPGESYIQFHNESYGLERVEILRGPVSGLYGAGDLGGIVHRIAKRPQPGHVNEVGLSLGNYASRQLRADLGGALGSGDHAWRTVMLAHENDPQADYPGFDERKTRRLYIAPSLALKLSDDTDLTLLADFRDLKTTSNPPEILGPKRQRSRALAYEPAFDQNNQRQWQLGYQFEHRFNDAWRLRQNLRTAEARWDAKAVGYTSIVDDLAADVARDAYIDSERQRYTALDTHVQGLFATGAIGHTVLLGVDYLQTRWDKTGYSGPGPTLNPLRPVYGQAVTPPSTLTTRRDSSLQQLGFYAQDQLAWNNWRLSAGLRHDRARQESDDRLAHTETRQADNATTGRIGVNYLFANGLAPYANYATSFLPQGGSDRHGKAFTPERGEQFELGVKYQPNARTLLTAAVYELTKQDVTTTDPVDRRFSIQKGEIRSRGLELEARQELFTGLNLIAQITLNEVEVTRSNDGDQGKAPNNTPRQMASAWLDYTLQGGELRGLGGGMGARYRGDSYADTDNRVINPAHTLLDAALWYRQPSWTARLNISNLADKDHVSSYAWGYYWGPRRTVNLSLDFRF